ncbi:MAG TPA: preprotein translocase subunit SecE [Actinomycetota bacterium]|nr:preprotein translocase subunit SecE [Actinomycetota bacterium]
MNREIKRRMKRDRQSAEKDVARARPPVPPPQRRERVKMRQFIREIQGELRRVIWPSAQEVVTYSTVVVVVVLLLTGIVFVLDLGFAKAIVALLRPGDTAAP